VREASRWGGKATIVVHRVPETDDYEGGYEAATMAGTPRGVVITSPGHASAEEALENLLTALGELGYAGTVAVEDATYVGGVQRYEMRVNGAAE
jgi:hypothetical protein